jgi:hypothetical protein
LYSRFCRSKNTKDNKKNMAFLLVWEKDSYIERFLVLSLCTHVLQPTLIHLYQTPSLLPSPLPIMVSVSLRLLYLFLYSGHIDLFQVLGFLPFPYFSCVCSPLSVWPYPIILLHLFWVYNPHMRENMQFLAFWTWLTLLKMMFSSSIHWLANDKISFFFMAE